MDSIFYSKDLNLLNNNIDKWTLYKKKIYFIVILILSIPMIKNEILIFKLNIEYQKYKTMESNLNLDINKKIFDETHKMNVLQMELEEYLLLDDFLEDKLELVLLKNILSYEGVFFTDINFGKNSYLKGYSNSKEEIFKYNDYLKASIDYKIINIKNIELLDGMYYFEIEIIFGGDNPEIN